MSNRQNTKRTTVSKDVPKRAPSKANRIAENTLYFLLYMTQRHPILFWTGSWLAMILVSWVAISGLTYTNPAPLEVSENPQPEAVAESPKPELQFQQPRQSNNSWIVLAAVAVSCAGVSVLLGRQLRPVKPVPKRAIKRDAEPQVAVRSHSVRSDRPPTPRRSPQPVNRAPKPSAPPQRVPVATTPQRSTPQPKVSVMPADAIHPLDWEDENLAEVMDIRKRPVSFEL